MSLIFTVTTPSTSDVIISILHPIEMAKESMWLVGASFFIWAKHGLVEYVEDDYY